MRLQRKDVQYNHSRMHQDPVQQRKKNSKSNKATRSFIYSFQVSVEDCEVYLSKPHLEKESRSSIGGNSYRIYDKKIVNFCPESIISPFVPSQEAHKGKKNIIFSNEDYCDMIYFTEETKMAAIV